MELLSRRTEEDTGWGPEIKIKDETGLGRAVLSVQQALMRKPVPLHLLGQENMSKMARRVEVPQKGSEAALFNKCRAETTTKLVTQRRGSAEIGEVRKASKDARKTFCNTVNELTMLARLHRALPREPKIKPRSLVAPSETYAIRRGNLRDLSYYSLS